MYLRFIWKSIGLLLLGMGCGALALGAFIYSILGDGGFLETVLGSLIGNHAVRGLYTGVAVLALIRSKIFQVRDVNVGLEYVYNEIRDYCLSSINIRWTAWRNAYVNRRLDALLRRIAMDDTFDSQLMEMVVAAVQNADDKAKASVVGQSRDVQSRRPTTPATISDKSWAAYGRALMNLTLENCGSKPLDDVLGEIS